ncbi:MAG: hypothetical protein ACT4OM_11460 [Actinomycetota bacterium]
MGCTLAGKLLIVAMVLTAACGSAQDPKRPVISTAGPTGTVEAGDDPAEREAVLIAYRRFWELYQLTGADPAVADLDAMAEVTGPELMESQEEGIMTYLERGTRLEGSLAVSPRVVELEPTRALVQDCIVNSLSEVNVATREVVLAPDPFPFVVDAVLQKTGGAWKLTEYVANNTEQGNCAP